MKFKWDRKYFYWGMTAFTVIIAVIVIYLILSNIGAISSTIGTVISSLKGIIYGLVLAYILNPLMKLLERPSFEKLGLKIYRDKPGKAKRFQRAIALTLTIILLFTFVTLILYMVLPKIYDSIVMLANNLPSYFTKVREFVAELFPAGSEIQASVIETFGSLESTISSFFSAESLAQLKDIATEVFSSLVTVATEIVNMFVGLVIAIYILLGKEKFAAQCKRFLYAHFSTERVSIFIQKLKGANKVFTGFIGGKIIDSLIVGITCYIALTIFNIPYKELVSVVIGITNMIPFFGPFIGAIPSALFILLIDPFKALTFIIIIIVIQQVDGNVIGPRVLGSATGLSGFWVIVAMLTGSAVMGVVGMIIGIPILAIIYAAVKTGTDMRLRKKGIPVSTSEYKEISYIDPDTKRPVTYDEVKAVEDAEKNEALKTAHAAHDKSIFMKIKFWILKKLGKFPENTKKSDGKK